LLFGLHRARSAFRKTGRAVLVEGNFDVISLHQAGFEEAVAPLGTALTDDQVDALRRLADEVALLYDGDRAGRIATRKALETLVEADVPVKIARLPAGEDPDSMVHRDDPEGGSDGGGVAELRRILDRAQPGPEYFIREVWRHAGDSADGRTRALGAAARVIQKVANPVKRDLITGTLASAMDVDIDTARRALRDAARPDARRGRDERGGPDRDGRPGADAPGPAAVVKPPPYFELQLLAILADHPQLLKTAEEHNVVSLLTDARLRDMYCAACQGSPMLAAAPDDIGPIAARHMLSGAYATMKDPNQGLLEVIASLRHPRRRLAQLQRQADEARRRGDEALERELVHEILTTRRQVD
ncbi:MAG: toprim domain-containing protein, partial [Myxococcota bacterium]